MTAEGRGTANGGGAAAGGSDRRVNRAPRTPRLARRTDRYSAFVQAMKVLLPLSALALIGLVFVLPQFGEAEKAVRESIKAQIKTQDLENLYMVKARYTGVDNKNRPYTLMADTARQVSTESDLVALEGPKADLTLEDGAWVAVRAKAGAFYRKRQVLILFGEVNLFHDKGYTVQTKEVEVDLTKGTAQGTKPVVAHGPLGILRAQGFKVLNRGETYLFTGKARLVINLTDEQIKRGASPGAAAPAPTPKAEAPRTQTGAAQ